MSPATAPMTAWSKLEERIVASVVVPLMKKLFSWVTASVARSRLMTRRLNPAGGDGDVLDPVVHVVGDVDVRVARVDEQLAQAAAEREQARAGDVRRARAGLVEAVRVPPGILRRARVDERVPDARVAGR